MRSIWWPQKVIHPNSRQARRNPSTVCIHTCIRPRNRVHDSHLPAASCKCLLHSVNQINNIKQTLEILHPIILIRCLNPSTFFMHYPRTYWKWRQRTYSDSLCISSVDAVDNPCLNSYESVMRSVSALPTYTIGGLSARSQRPQSPFDKQWRTVVSLPQVKFYSVFAL